MCCYETKRIWYIIRALLGCQAIYSPILTASALRWKKTRLAAAPSTVTIL
nr:MAG TPA: hypothetical protein [Caudoviricetes sp.]